MTLSDFNPQTLAFKAIAILVSVLLLCGAVYELINHYENVGYQRRVAEEDVQRNKDLEAAAIKTRALQSQLDEAQYELSITKQKLATLTASNVVLANRLRDSLTKYNSNLSNDSKQALIERVNSLSDVLGECTSRYTEVAAKADSYTADLKMMQDSWPK